MKNQTLLILLVFLILSCNNTFTNSKNGSPKFNRKKIAVLPFQIHTTVNELPEGITMGMVDQVEQEKANWMQLDLYRYLLREYAVSSRKVSMQTYNETNKILKDKGIEYNQIFSLPKRKLANILKVDVLLYGNIYQFKRKLELNENALIKSNGQNSIATVIYAYGKNKKERILWKDDQASSGFPSEYGPDITKNLLRKAAKNFPF